jgi:hypothetical protein
MVDVSGFPLGREAVLTSNGKQLLFVGKDRPRELAGKRDIREIHSLSASPYEQHAFHLALRQKKVRRGRVDGAAGMNF